MTALSPAHTAAAESLDAVAAACAFLSNLLLRPEAGAGLGATLEADTARSWPLRGNVDVTAGVAGLVDALASGLSSDDVAADYERLFVGPGRMLACPYESVHRSREGLTFEAETLQVRMAYAAFGLQAPAVNREPDDHIGLELAFIGELAVAALRSLEDGDVPAALDLIDAQLSFVRDHLGAWGPGLATMIVDGAQTELYRAVGLLLRGTIALLEPVLTSVAEQVDGAV